MMDPWIRALPPHWTRGCDPALFEEARERHLDSRRAYHDWRHVEACVEALRALDATAPRTALLALLFHDAVYVPGAEDNERRSADLAGGLLARHSDLAQAERDAVRRIIVATADHHANAAMLAQGEALALDADLSVLGAPWDRYALYAAGVRREYCPDVLSEGRFDAARAGFLQKLLEAPHVFVTPAGRARWESKARANISRELAELRAKLSRP